MQKKALPAACSTLIAVMVCIGLVLGLYAVIFLPLKTHPAYRMGLELAKNDPAVIELFGSPVKDGLFVGGKTQGNLYGGSASLETSISGPKASGTISILGIKNESGAWRIQSVDIRIDRKLALTYRGTAPDKGFQPAP